MVFLFILLSKQFEYNFISLQSSTYLNKQIKKIKKDVTEKNAELTTEKKLRNVRTCLYILILAAITKLAMTDFTELSYQSWISVIIITLVIILVLAIERGIRKKLKEEKE